MSKDRMQKLREQFAKGKPVIASGGKHDRLIIGKNETVRMRILPGEYGPNEMFYAEQIQHWIPNGDGKDMPYACLAQLDDPEPCRCCYWWGKFQSVDLSKAKGPDGDKLRKIFDATKRKLSYRRSYLMNVVNREEHKLQLYGSPQTVFGQIYEQIESNLNDDDGTYLLDEESGHDITVVRTDKAGEGGSNNVSYKVAAVLKPSRVDNDYPADKDGSWLSERVDLDKLIRDDLDKTRRYQDQMNKAVDQLCEPVWKKVAQYAVSLGDDDEDGGSYVAGEGEEEDDIDTSPSRGSSNSKSSGTRLTAEPERKQKPSSSPSTQSSKSARDLLAEDEVNSGSVEDVDSLGGFGPGPSGDVAEDDDMADLMARAKGMLSELQD